MDMSSFFGGSIMVILGSIVLIVSLSALSTWHRVRSTEHVSIRDTTVADEHVSITGEARPVGDGLTSPIQSTSCVGYTYRIDRRKSGSWSPVDSGSDVVPFLVDDGTATAYVDPSTSDLQISTDQITNINTDEIDEEVNTKPSLTGRRRYHEGTIALGDHVYVQGIPEDTHRGDADVQFISEQNNLVVSNQSRQSTMNSQLKKGGLLLPIGLLFIVVGVWLIFT